MTMCQQGREPNPLVESFLHVFLLLYWMSCYNTSSCHPKLMLTMQVHYNFLYLSLLARAHFSVWMRRFLRLSERAIWWPPLFFTMSSLGLLHEINEEAQFAHKKLQCSGQKKKKKRPRSWWQVSLLRETLYRSECGEQYRKAQDRHSFIASNIKQNTCPHCNKCNHLQKQSKMIKMSCKSGGSVHARKHCTHSAMITCSLGDMSTYVWADLHCISASVILCVFMGTCACWW